MATMRKTEDRLNTPEQVEEYVAEAIRVAIAAKLSNAERQALLPTLVTLLASKQVFYEQAVMGGGLDLSKLNARH